MVIDSYAPILAAGYRRAMLGAIGDDAAVSTVRRFEERFALEPEVLDAIQAEVSGR
jgi:hypothetical protein